MAVTTIINNRENKYSTALIYVLGIIGIGLVVFFGGKVIETILNKNGKAGLTVETVYSQAEVIIDGEKIGETPYTSKDLKPGNKTITVKTDSRQYQTTANFIPADNGTLHVVALIRDLGVSDTFSSGQEFWFEKNGSENTLRMISEPSGATVYIDGSEVGKTPFSSDNISPGNYTIAISYPNYESQTAEISIQKGYVLNGSIKLFPYPVSEKPSLFENSSNLYDISTDNPLIYSDTESWAKAVVYWNKTRGLNIDNSLGIKDQVFDFFLDYKGNIFNKDGNIIKSDEDRKAMGELKKGAYLGKLSEGKGLTKEASEALSTISGNVSLGKTAVIKQTPNGWLRVRDSGSLSGKEIGKVNTGEKYPVLEEKSGWIKIKVSSTLTGWVSSEYTSIEE